jgi:hypothetical protein
MGYWGFEPKSGDAPMDYFTVIEDAMVKQLKKLYKPKAPAADDRFERLGFVQLCYESHLPIPIAFMEKAIEDIKVCVLDTEFVGDWQDPDAFIVVMRNILETWQQGVDEEKARAAQSGTPREYQTVQLEPCVPRPSLFDALDEAEDEDGLINTR